MRSDDFGIEELDVLTSMSDRTSIDPNPSRSIGMDPRIVKDIINDHIRSLRNINHSLPTSKNLDAALTALEGEYYKLFGQRLTELMTHPAEVKTAVLELRRQLSAIVKSDQPDLTRRNINNIMQKICKDHKCTPASLHDCFIETFYMTPDHWAKEQLNN